MSALVNVSRSSWNLERERDLALNNATAICYATAAEQLNTLEGNSRSDGIRIRFGVIVTYYVLGPPNIRWRSCNRYWHHDKCAEIQRNVRQTALRSLFEQCVTDSIGSLRFSEYLRPNATQFPCSKWTIAYLKLVSLVLRHMHSRSRWLLTQIQNRKMYEICIHARNNIFFCMPVFVFIVVYMLMGPPRCIIINTHIHAHAHPMQIEEVRYAHTYGTQ